jgi:formate dehydrogenase beta subunit
LKPTDIGAPDYFHKVVDCQWACPAHTPVPEYIRLIAAGRYSDAYMVNWVSNVFPGILGRTCDRPCEPACRRSRVEDETADGHSRKEPVAICRLKRVAADYKQDIRGLLPQPAEQKNGRRIACIGAGPASLTVARDLAPLGYEVVIYDGDARAGGMMRTQIPKFRLPEEVIDEETGYVLGLGVDFRSGQYVSSLKDLLAEGYDAVFVGSGAPRGQDLDIPGRKEAAKHIHLGIDWLANVAFGHTTSISKRVIVLGGGNTAMDCCRSARRLGGEDVKVIVRSGFEQMKASPWEKEDAMHEGIPILNNLVPKAFTHNGGRLTGVTFSEGAFGLRRAGTAQPRTDRRAGRSLPCDVVLVAVGQDNAFPVDRARHRHRVRQVGAAQARRTDHAIDRANVFFGGDAAFGPKNIIWAVAHGHEAAVSIDRLLNGEDIATRPDTDDHAGVAEDGHPRLALRQRDLGRPPPARAAARHRCGTEEHQDRGRTGFRPATRVQGGAALPELRRADGVHAQAVHRMRRLHGHLPDGLHQLHRQRRGGRTAPAPARAGAQHEPGSVRLGDAEDRAGDGQGRGRLPALRPVRRALPDRRLGHAEVSARRR